MNSLVSLTVLLMVFLFVTMVMVRYSSARANGAVTAHAARLPSVVPSGTVTLTSSDVLLNATCPFSRLRVKSPDSVLLSDLMLTVDTSSSVETVSVVMPATLMLM